MKSLSALVTSLMISCMPVKSYLYTGKVYNQNLLFTERVGLNWKVDHYDHNKNGIAEESWHYRNNGESWILQYTIFDWNEDGIADVYKLPDSSNKQYIMMKKDEN